MSDRARQPVPPLLPAPARQAALAVIGGCTVLVAVGAAAAAGRSSGDSLDRPVDRWILDHLGAHYRLLHAVADIGAGLPLLALTAVLVLACLAAGRLNGAILTVVSLAIASGLTELVLKPLVHETIGRPPALSYPSGHMTNAFSLIAVIAVLLVSPPSGRPGRRLRLALAIIAVLIGAAVAVSLIGIRFHYFTDTVAGAAVATAVVLACTFLLDTAVVRGRLGRVSVGRT
jgi:membrane-associated phospholipid phosphatase